MIDNGALLPNGLPQARARLSAGQGVAIAIAVAGSIQQISVPRTVAAVGELSLAGEIRPVTQSAQRRSEAARLGYEQVVDDRSKTLRAALNDVRARNTSRRSDRDIPPF